MRRYSYTKAVYWFAGLIVALAAGLSLVLSFLDWNQYRIPLAQFASDQMGMRVELAGDVSLALFPRPLVSAETVRLFPATEGFSEVVATANRIGVNLGVASLVRGKFTLQSLRLDGLDITLQETEEGRWQVRGWPDTEDTSGPEVDLLRFRLTGSRATLLPYGGNPTAIEGVSLTLEGTLPGGPLSWEGEFTVAEERIVSSGRVRPVSVRDELSVKADFTLAENSLSVSGRILPEGDLTGRLELMGDSISGLLSALGNVTGNSTVSAPDLPYRLDVQLDRTGDITKLISRELTISDTRGRLDLTAAEVGRRNHVTGTVSMGVIDFDHWLAATTLKEDTAPIIDELTDSEPSVTGAIDFHIEGFQVRNGLGQRIDAVVALDADGISLSSASALLPGATNAAFTGKLGQSGGQGKLLVEAGNISELASWLGLSFPDGIPAGRLTTAKLKANLGYSGETWGLSNVAAQLDNTNFSGQIDGGLRKTGPWQIKLSADRLNLDAYLPKTVAENSDAKSLRLPPETDVEFDVAIGNLQLLGNEFSSTRFVGVLREEKLNLSHMVSQQAGGRIELSGSVEQGEGQPRFDISAKVTDWGAPIASYFAPTLPTILQSLKVDQVNGTLTLVGAKDALNLGLDLTNDGDLLSLSGLVDLSENTFSKLDLQGSFNHSDLAGLLRYNEIIDLKSLPVRASLNVSKVTQGAPLQVRIGGDAAGGDITTELVLQGGLRKLDLTFNHTLVADFSMETGLKLSGFDHSASLRSDLRFEASSFPSEWTLSLDTLRNGRLSASGNIAVSGGNQINGALNLSGADIRLESSRADMAVQPSDVLTQLNGYAGTIDVVLRDVDVAGQMIDAPTARLALGDGAAQMLFGAGAEMNGESLVGSLTVNLLGSLAYEGNINAAKFDVGSLLLAEGKKQVLSGNTSFTLDFSGQADTSDILKGMKATGSVSGQGATLHFLSVSGLVGEIQTAQTGSAFLGKVGSFLRNGSTPVQTVEGAFSLDSGIMLVESAKAAGGWGSLSLDGQLNFPDEFLTLKGELALTTPRDTPVIPVSYEGRFDRPLAQWSSRLFERFVISIIERRLRATLFKELDERTKTSQEAGSNPGMAVFSRAFDLLSLLRKEQEEKKRAAEQAEAARVPEGGAP